MHLLWARDGTQGRKRGSSETIQDPGRLSRPRLVKDLSLHVRQCHDDLAAAQVWWGGGGGRVCVVGGGWVCIGEGRG